MIAALAGPLAPAASRLVAVLLIHVPFTHQPSAADSATAAVEHAARALDLGGWHEFYLLAGTAAVTLVGLLFVALSFHLDTLLHDSKSHLLAAARMSFMNYLFVLLLSLLFLMPGIPPRVLGAAVAMLSVLSLGYLVWNGLRSRRSRPLSEHEQFLRRRFMVAGFVLGMGMVSAVNFVLEPRRISLVHIAAITIGMLANAAGMSWDLLVQVGRMRRAAGGTPKA